MSRLQMIDKSGVRMIFVYLKLFYPSAIGVYDFEFAYATI